MFYNKQKNKDKDIPCQGTSARFSPHQVQVHSTMGWTCYVYYTSHGLNNYAPPSALENSHHPTCCHIGCTFKTQNQTVRWEFWSCRLVVLKRFKGKKYTDGIFYCVWNKINRQAKQGKQSRPSFNSSHLSALNLFKITSAYWVTINIKRKKYSHKLIKVTQNLLKVTYLPASTKKRMLSNRLDTLNTLVPQGRSIRTYQYIPHWHDTQNDFNT